MTTVGFVFFLARAYQHKTNKIGITILAPLQLKLCILQDRNYFKSTLLALILLEKYPKQQVTYFYQILHFMMNPAIFGSPHLDTPRSRYKFLKFAFKYMKINKENQISNQAQQLGAPSPVYPEALTAGAHRSMQLHMSVRPRQGAAFNRRELVDGEVSGGTVTTVMFPSTSCLE